MLDDMRGLIAFVQWVARIHAAPCEVILRKWGTFGSRYPGLPALCALFYIPVFCAFLPLQKGAMPSVPDNRFGYAAIQEVKPAPQNNYAYGIAGPAGVLGFMGIYVVALFIHRIKGIQLRARGREFHSMFVGESRFGKGEAATCSFLGLLISPLCVPVGIYFIFGGVAMAINEQVISMHDNARVRAMKDSRIEARYYAERIREEEDY